MPQGGPGLERVERKLSEGGGTTSICIYMFFNRFMGGIRFGEVRGIHLCINNLNANYYLLINTSPLWASY